MGNYLCGNCFTKPANRANTGDDGSGMGLVERPSYQIAIKNPFGLKYIFYNPYEKKFVSDNNIQDWLSGLYMGINRSNKKLWQHWIVYNDEPPFMFNHKESIFLRPKATKGHCKGILAWNDNEMSWFIHSVPCFPDYFDPNGTESHLMGRGGNTKVFSEIHYSEEIYAHSFGHFYLSWEKEGDIENGEKRIRELLEHIRIMEPCIYLSKGFWGTSYSEKWSNLISRNYYLSTVMEENEKDSDDDTVELISPTLEYWNGGGGDGAKWGHYAKSPYYEEDFYDALAGVKGGCRVGSSLCEYEPKLPDHDLVKNNTLIYSLQFSKYGTPHSLIISERQDHSKWAISVGCDREREEESWVCLGDLDRCESQAKKGGGGIVIMDEDLHRAWKTLIGNQAANYL